MLGLLADGISQNTLEVIALVVFILAVLFWLIRR